MLAPHSLPVCAVADAAVAAVAVAVAVTTAATVGVGTDSLQATILSLATGCDDGCAGRVGDGLATAGCGGVRHFRGLGVVAARCPATAAGAGTSRGGGTAYGAMRAAANDDAGGDVLTSVPGVAAWALDKGVTAAAPVGGGGDGARAPPMLVAAATAGSYLRGLDRINQATLPLDRRTATGTCYPRVGAGVHVYIVDSGCRSDHAQFAHLAAERRLSILPAIGSDFASGEDDNGHGTHVAGTVVGRETGIAPGVALTCAKATIKDGRCSYADILSAFDMATVWGTRHPTTPVLLTASLGTKRPRAPSGTVHPVADMMARPRATALPTRVTTRPRQTCTSLLWATLATRTRRRHRPNGGAAWT